MLSEIFVDLEIDDEAPSEIPFCKPEDFKPFIQSENWFMDPIHTETTEILSQKAFLSYHTGNFQLAYQLFSKLLTQGNHNRVHQVSIYDSIIRSSLKMKPSPQETLSLLHKYKDIATEYGDQLQYWNTAALVFQNYPTQTFLYLKMVVMLCSAVDSPDHWALFGNNSFIEKGPNFDIAYRIRINGLLDHNMDFAAGFVKDRLKAAKIKIENELTSETAERKAIAKAHIVTDLLRANSLRELRDDIKRPAHDCRFKIGVFKTEDMMTQIFRDFLNRYWWMFEGMPLL